MPQLVKQGKKSLRHFTAPIRMLPDFLIIGAQRCGTTSLYNYLAAHPCVGAATKKEIRFFDVNWTRGVNWYRTHFPPQIRRLLHSHKLLTGEATPYYLYHPAVPERVRGVLPGAKFLVLLRNPADRAYSHHQMQVRCGMEALRFEEALAQEAERLAASAELPDMDDGPSSLEHRRYSYLARGIYADQLERWFKVFPPDRFLILNSEQFYAAPAGVLEQVVAFLGLPEHHAVEYRKFNDGGYEPMHPVTRKRLLQYFAPHNQRLAKLLGFPFDWDR
jgi:sulfotransferase family protein